MKKDLAIIFGLFLLIVILLVFGQSFSSVSYLTTDQSQKQMKKTTTILAKTLTINADIASKASDRKKGLSNKESLPLNQGMLFIFDTKGRYGIWMKDMKFAIDIIWIDENKNIVDIVSDAPPQPGKKDSELTIYKPRGDSLYVLEVNAGLANLHNLQISDQVSFEL